METKGEVFINKFDMFAQILLGSILLCCSIKDIKTRKISMIIVIPGLLILLICLPFRNNLTIISGLMGASIGLFMIGIGKVSNWQVGMGDGIILIIAGIGVGFWESVALLLYSLCLIFLYSIVLFVLKKITKKTTIPFIPFLFIGYIGVIICKFY